MMATQDDISFDAPGEDQEPQSQRANRPLRRPAPPPEASSPETELSPDGSERTQSSPAIPETNRSEQAEPEPGADRERRREEPIRPERPPVGRVESRRPERPRVRPEREAEPRRERASQERGGQEAEPEATQEQAIRAHAERRGVTVPDAGTASLDVGVQVESNARTRGILQGGLMGAATFLATFVLWPAATPLAPVFGAGVGILYGVSVYRDRIRKGKQELLKQQRESATERTDTTIPIESREATGAVDETIVDGRSDLRLAEALRRGVAQQGIQYRPNFFLLELLGTQYVATAQDIERMNKDKAHREASEHRAGPRDL